MFMLGHVLGKGAYSVVHLATLKKPLEVTMTKMGGGKSTDSSGKAQELERFRTGTQFAVKIIKKGGTMRLGSWDCDLNENTISTRR